VWLNFRPCGVQIDRVQVARIKEDGSLDLWQEANNELLIIQWTFDPITAERNYGVYDLLGDMAQTRYIVQVRGHGKSGAVFIKNLWVSPAGFSNKPIKLAPLRDLDTAAWNEDDWRALQNWYMREHQFSTKAFFKEFNMMLWHADRNMQLIIKIGSENCLQSSSDKVN